MLCPLRAKTLKRASAGAAIPALLILLFAGVFIVFSMGSVQAMLLPTGNGNLNCAGTFGETDVACTFSHTAKCDVLSYLGLILNTAPLQTRWMDQNDIDANFNSKYNTSIHYNDLIESPITENPALYGIANGCHDGLCISIGVMPDSCYTEPYICGTNPVCYNCANPRFDRCARFDNTATLSGTIRFKRIPACTIDEQCAEGEICKEGKCAGCTQNSDCGATGNCVSGKCDYTCSDGTANMQCSATSKPLYCSKGNLIPMCLICGCDDGFSCIGNTTCSMPGKLTITDMILNKNPAIATPNSFKRSIDILGSGSKMDGVYAIVEVTNSMNQQTTGYLDVKAYHNGVFDYQNKGDEIIAITLEPNSKREVMIPLDIRADKLGIWTYDLILRDNPLGGSIIDTAVANLTVLDNGNSAFNGPKVYGNSIIYETDDTRLSNEQTDVALSCSLTNIAATLLMVVVKLDGKKPETGLIDCELLVPNLTRILQGITINKLKDTAIVHLNSKHMGSYRELNISWKNLAYLDVDSPYYNPYHAQYDRAVIKLTLPANVRVLDNAQADYYFKNDTLQKQKLVWIINNADKAIKYNLISFKEAAIRNNYLFDPNGVINLKIEDSTTGDYNISASLELQIGPFKAPLEKSYLGIHNSPYIQDYEKWNSNPDQVYWYSLGYDEHTMQITPMPPDTIRAPSSGGGGSRSSTVTTPVVTAPVVANPVTPVVNPFASVNYLFGNANSVLKNSNPLSPKISSPITGNAVNSNSGSGTSGGIVTSVGKAVSAVVNAVTNTVGSIFKGIFGLFGLR